MGLRPKGSEKTPLWFGTGVHLALAEWYLPGLKRGVHPAETFKVYAEGSLHSVKVADATEETVAQYEDGLELGLVLMDEYVRRYGRDESWEFIEPERAFSIDVPWPTDRQALYEVDPATGDLLVRYCGIFDGVYRDLTDGKIKLLETKTAKAIQTSHLSLDDQAGSYWAVASQVLRAENVLEPGEGIKEIVYNFIRKALPDDRPVDAEGYATNKPTKAHYVDALAGLTRVGRDRATLGKLKLEELESIAAKFRIPVIGERSKIQPPPLFLREPVHRTTRERGTQLRRIQDEAVQMRAARDGILPLTKNPTRDCSWDCAFFNLCEYEERGGNPADLMGTFKVQDPYADHRKSSDE